MRKPIVPFDLHASKLAEVFDELPLWSAPFGLALLDAVMYKPAMNVLDIGCGTGFPAMELAQRLGDSCRVWGIDPWPAALARARRKTTMMHVANVELVEGAAEHMPFTDGFFDLLVSNNGTNNVEDERQALAECHRVCKPGGQFVLTANLPGTMTEFYDVYRQTLRQHGKESVLQKLDDHIAAKRKPVEERTKLLMQVGFSIRNIREDSFTMRFLDGTALFNHYFMRLAFVPPWQEILEEDVASVFDALEENLNRHAASHGELKLSIPFVCIDCGRE
jgi:ubiquinone/menaquinone biosynthesis C-methylase UbiE